ncbi:LCP family protein [Candidatus Peregrinibacteria bacterium]|nr:LCP family protein [Candidatus Peregrinibacteria bacterium]
MNFQKRPIRKYDLKKIKFFEKSLKHLKDMLKNVVSSRNLHNSSENAKSTTKAYQITIRQGAVKHFQPKGANGSSKDVFQHVLTLIIGITVGAIITYSGYFFLKNINISTLVSPFSKEIKTDENGITNFLILGTGNEEHEGSYLTDAIMVASLNTESGDISLMSLPRDLYTVTEFGPGRINQIYETGVKKNISEKGLQILVQTIEKIIGQKMHYYAKIDFDGFVEGINAIGGIDIFIENTIIDTSYPLGETHRSETFILKKGLQHLDGETALKYVRTRKCNICLDGDFGRGKRQQNLLQAVKAKTLSSKTLLNPSKIKKILTVIGNNFETNLTLREILYIAKIAENVESSDIYSWVIHDDPTREGGFLYVPERKYYGGAFVLIPQTNPSGIKEENPYYEINDFAYLVLKYPKIMKEQKTIYILNGTKINGLASEVSRYLIRYGFNVIDVGNAENRNNTKTILKYTENEKPKILDLITKMLQGEIQKLNSNEAEAKLAHIIIILGEDFYTLYQNNKARFY